MKIWFDLSNSPHINMFYDLIRDLEHEGHEIIITSRPLANTVDLLKQRKLNFTVVGEHYGKNIFKKLFGYPIRVFQLVKFLSGLKPDLAVSQSSFHSPLVARLLGIPSIYTNDNEHAAGNMPSFLFSTRILVPEFLSKEKIARRGGAKRKIIQYPGVKEGIYLWRKGMEINEYRDRHPSEAVKIYFRPEPLTAQYYNGEVNFLDSLIEEIQHQYHVTILTRDRRQLLHFKQKKFYAVEVPEKPLPFDDIARDCTLFIGAGGSMTREMAILGIPTISVYQGELLEVDKFLIEKNIMEHDINLNAEKVKMYIEKNFSRNPDCDLMTKGRLAYDLFLEQIESFAMHPKLGQIIETV
jgi:hypothetical protein